MKRSISRIAMAAALSLGVAGMVGVAAPAEAAKKEKQAKGGEYSKEFIGVYQPIAEKVDASTDGADLKGSIPALVAAAKSPDETMVAGQLIYNIGAKANDQALQYQGVKLMADSGKVPADNAGKIYLAAGQLGYNAKDYAASRAYLTKAKGLLPNDPQIPTLIAETYVAEGNFTQALSDLKAGIDASVAAGQPVDDATAFRGLAIAANNGLNDQAFNWAITVLESSPRKEYRGEAYKILSALSPFNKEEELDLLRLMYRNDGLTVRQQYLAYLQTLDARRRPGEVKSVIEKGMAAGLLSGSTLATDELGVAKTRLSQVQREIDADSTNPSGASEAMAIADVYLGYGNGAKAEALYQMAIEKGVTNKAAALTGLGIAQADQGKYAEAKATFQQITTGNRSTLAKLWIAYINDQTAG